MTAQPALRLVAPADPADTAKRRLAKRADYLARVRQSVPERRETVLHKRGIVWRQFPAVIIPALEAKAEREIGYERGEG